MASFDSYVRFLKRCIYYEARRVWREKKRCVLILLCAFFFQGAFFALLVVWEVHGFFEEQSVVVLELREDIDDQARQEFYTALNHQTFVRNVHYVTGEETQEKSRAQYPELTALIEESIIRQPFRDTLHLSLQSPSHYNDLIAFVGEDRWSRIVDPLFLSVVVDQQEWLSGILRSISTLWYVSFGVCLLVIALFWMFFSLSLSKRRIYILSLFGVKGSYVSLFFIARGVLCAGGVITLAGIVFFISSYVTT